MNMLALLLVAGAAQGQESAAFLRLGAGARAAGMGGAGAAVTEDVNALAGNPAGLAGVPGRELGFTHAELLQGARYEFLGFAQNTSFGTIGAAGTYLTQGGIEGRDALGRPSGGFSASDSAASLSFARRLDFAAVGATVKVLQSRIADASAQSVAFDLGARRDLSAAGPGVPMLGLAVQNMGQGLRLGSESNPLPLTVAAGLGYRLPVGLTVAADFKHRPHASRNELCVGTEYAMLRGLAVRGGYASAQAHGNAGSSLTGVAAGLGLTVLGYQLDYAMTPFGELGNVQRFSLNARFR